MTDKLTQLQECLDQLSIQFYASLKYLLSHHPLPPIFPPPPQPLSPPPTADPSQQPPDQNPASPALKPTDADPSSTHVPTPPHVFAAAMQELAHDLILKQQQIEILIKSLPGIEKSEGEQMERIRGLEGELRGLEGEGGKRERVWEEKERLVEMVEGVVGMVRRV